MSIYLKLYLTAIYIIGVLAVYEIYTEPIVYKKEVYQWQIDHFVRTEIFPRNLQLQLTRDSLQVIQGKRSRTAFKRTIIMKNSIGYQIKKRRDKLILDSIYARIQLRRMQNNLKPQKK